MGIWEFTHLSKMKNKFKMPPKAKDPTGQMSSKKKINS